MVRLSQGILSIFDGTKIPGKSVLFQNAPRRVSFASVYAECQLRWWYFLQRTAVNGISEAHLAPFHPDPQHECGFLLCE